MVGSPTEGRFLLCRMREGIMNVFGITDLETGELVGICAEPLFPPGEFGSLAQLFAPHECRRLMAGNEESPDR